MLMMNEKFKKIIRKMEAIKNNLIEFLILKCKKKKWIGLKIKEFKSRIEITEDPVNVNIDLWKLDPETRKGAKKSF